MDGAAVIAGGQHLAVGAEGQRRDLVDVRQQRRDRPAGRRVPDLARGPSCCPPTRRTPRRGLAIARRRPSGLKARGPCQRPALDHRRADRLARLRLDQSGHHAGRRPRGEPSGAERGAPDRRSRPAAAASPAGFARIRRHVEDRCGFGPADLPELGGAVLAGRSATSRPSGENATSTRSRPNARRATRWAGPWQRSQSRAVMLLASGQDQSAVGRERRSTSILRRWRSGPADGRSADRPRSCAV